MSKLDPKKPAYKPEGASGYSPAEDVNQGPHGGRKGKVTPFHGQSSGAADSNNETGEKDRLMSWTENQQDPYRAKGEDFEDGHKVAARHGQSTGAEKLNSDTPEKNRLAMQSENQCGTRYVEDDGPGEAGSGTPVPGDRNARVAANFKIEQNDGESEGDTGEIGIGTHVNLQTGAIEGGHKQTRVGEVPEDSVTIG